MVNALYKMVILWYEMVTYGMKWLWYKNTVCCIKRWVFSNDQSEGGVFIRCMLNNYSSGFFPEVLEGVVPFSGVVKLGRITKVTQSAT